MPSPTPSSALASSSFPPFDPATFPEPTLVRVNGVELEVVEAGRPGRPLVLCHGWPEHAFSWRYQLPVLAAAGYHVIVPNQRGYGRSSRPDDVTAYDLAHLSGDLVGLLDHFGYADATFVGHDWGAMVVWGTALLHPSRVRQVINLSLPYQERGETPWIEWLEQAFGEDVPMVHYNRQPGVADAVFDADPARFLRNLYRRDLPLSQPQPGCRSSRWRTPRSPRASP
ncbi:MAG: alpha/beta hydrolase [Kineosporiaceae bacterium]